MRKVASNLNTICQRVKSTTDTTGAAFRNARNVTTSSSIRQCPALVPDWAPRDYNISLAQQIRNYVPKQQVGHRTRTPPCWNCKQSAGRQYHMRCAACGCLQDLNMEVNFFDLLSFEANFNVEQEELTKRYRKLQSLVHPDKFGNSTAREQANSADWSSLINKAYKTLSSPIERGQYLLRLNGEEMPESNSAMNKEFLLEMMERNEEVEATHEHDELQALHDKMRDEFDGKCTELEEVFETKNLEQAKMILVKMKYLLSIQTSIKNRLYNMLDG